jgi:acetoin utilization deacetylase AcuC-like enzyme/nucleotide-binding universal stress UspA family protein
MDSILCTLDLSSDAARVAAWAAEFAQRLNLPLLVFHAIHTLSDAIYPSAEFERGGDLERRRAECSAAIEAVMHPIAIPWRLEIVFGDPAEMVQQYCRTHEVALVVAGSMRMTVFKRFFLGTVVERMVRMLPCPLLVVRSGQSSACGLTEIGVCSDRSESGRQLVAGAAELAQAFGARLLIYSALETALDSNAAPMPYTRAQGELQQHWRDDLIAMIPAERRESLEVSVHLAFGDALDEIPALVGTHPPDLLIVGVRPRSTLGQWMSGSTTESLLRKAPCHVLARPFGGLKPGALAPAPDQATGIVRDPVFLAHRSAGEHPENPGRLESIGAMLDTALGGRVFCAIPPRAASVHELSQLHDPAYIQKIAATAGRDFTLLTPDTYACAASYEAACRAAGAVLSAVDAVMAGKVRNAFVPVRPPGHHAEFGKALGYCLFNNVALGAAYARAVKGLDRVLIVDWDLHHGNGIQHLFEADPAVLYISTHQYPCFPGTGHSLEVGRGRGEGYTINLPLGKRWTDADYAALFLRLVVPVTHSFRPDLILVAAGFDIHKKDPVGRMRVTELGFAALTRILMDLAHTCCDDRLVLVLEGGYHAKALADSVQAVLAEMSDQTHTDPAQVALKAKPRRVRPVVHRCIYVHGNIWPCLKPETGR